MESCFSVYTVKLWSLNVNDGLVASNVLRLHSMMFPPSGIRTKIEQTDSGNVFSAALDYIQL